MVAYSFQKRFVPLIASGRKRQTIRLHRPRHARVGELVQLYYAMRTKHCRKIVADPICTGCRSLNLSIRGGLIERVEVNTTTIRDLDAFAVLDGFESRVDMSEFWARQHPGIEKFDGVQILWEPRIAGEEIAA